MIERHQLNHRVDFAANARKTTEMSDVTESVAYDIVCVY